MYKYARLSIFRVYSRWARRVFLFLTRALLVHHSIARGNIFAYLSWFIVLIVFRFTNASVNISAYVVFSKIHRTVNITILQYLQRYINFLQICIYDHKKNMDIKYKWNIHMYVEMFVNNY